MPEIGSKLRELRARRSLGMRELAARSGVSHSAISLIERNRMSPSVDTLSALLAALGSTMSAFFGDLDSGVPYSPFYGADELVEIGRPNRVSYRLVGMNHPNRRMLLLCERYAPGAATETVLSHVAEEAGIVVRGAVEVTVDGSTRVLREGDAYYFDSRSPHRFRNVSDGVSEIISAVTPPTY
jgi:transcriptional regulator with XRE-family HTH domain